MPTKWVDRFFFFLFLTVLFPLFLRSVLAGPLDARGFLEANGQRPATGGAAFVQGNEQGGLKEPKSQNRIGVEGRRKRVAPMERLLDAPAGLMQLGVVHGHAHEPSRTQFQTSLEDGGKQPLRLPLHARVQEVLGRPVALFPTIGPDDARQRPAPQTHQRSQSLAGRPNARALLWENLAPGRSNVQLGFQQPHGAPSFTFTAKVFLPVRTKRSPRITFLVSEDTRLSRSTGV